MGIQLPLTKRGTAPQFSDHICCGQMAGWIKMPLGTKVSLDPSNIVLDGDPARPSTKGGKAFPQIFGPCLLWPNGWMDQDATWHTGRPQPSTHCVRWEPSSPSPKRAQPPQFSAHICCGQMSGWIKMPLGTEVRLNPSNSVLDRDPNPPPQKGRRAPQF